MTRAPAVETSVQLNTFLMPSSLLLLPQPIKVMPAATAVANFSWFVIFIITLYFYDFVVNKE